MRGQVHRVVVTNRVQDSTVTHTCHQLARETRGQVFPEEKNVTRLSFLIRDAVLGHPEIGSPKIMTQYGVTHPLKPCLIGICKDMMSRMDPMRAWKWQDEVAGTFFCHSQVLFLHLLLERTTQTSGGREQEHQG